MVVNINNLKNKLKVRGRVPHFSVWWTPFWPVCLQHGRCPEPGVVFPPALLRPLQAGRRRLGGPVPAPTGPVHVWTNQHGLTSSLLRMSGWNSASGPKAQNVFIYFSIRWLLVKKDLPIVEVGVEVVCCCLTLDQWGWKRKILTAWIVLGILCCFYEHVKPIFIIQEEENNLCKCKRFGFMTFVKAACVS